MKLAICGLFVFISFDSLHVKLIVSLPLQKEAILITLLVKKNIMKNRLHLLVLLLPAYLLMSYSSGAPAGKTGSLGDGGNTCSTAGCHTSNGASYMPNIAVTGFPSSGYAPGQTYRLQLEVSSASNNKTGFECVVENSSNRRMGTFASINSNTQAVNSSQYITHTSAGTTSHNWLFDWTAPATSQGNLIFYYAINLANGNGLATGDYVETGNFVISENTSIINEISDNNIKIFPNPTTDYLYINSDKGSIQKAQIMDINGKFIGISTTNNQIDVSFLPSGKYFLYIETENVTGVKQFIKK